MGPLPKNKKSGYTLLEILLAIGIIAILMGATLPYFSSALGGTDHEKMAAAIEELVLRVHSQSAEQNKLQRIILKENGLFGDEQTSALLPTQWKLEVRRLTETQFRRPTTNEVWEFNSAGICEPLTLRIHDGKETIEMTFDPLTGLVVDES